MVLSKTRAVTTIEDSTVSVDINDQYSWIVTNNTGWAPLMTGDKVNLTVQDIYGEGGYLTMNATLDYYNITDYTWTNVFNGTYLTFNETLDEIEYTTVQAAIYGWIFIIPTPLNLTMIGEHIISSNPGVFSGMSTSDTNLTLVGIGGSFECRYTFHENGIQINFEVESLGILIYKMVIEGDLPDDSGDNGDENGDENGNDDNGIPFGNTYLLIAIIGIVIVGILSKRRKIINN
ncbi:MAG: hypothetical protein ACFFCE_10020 [Promethearchaeota archaeon]